MIRGGSFTNVRPTYWRLYIMRTPIFSSRIRAPYYSKRAQISWGHSRITLLLNGSRILSDPTASVRLLIDLIDLIRLHNEYINVTRSSQYWFSYRITRHDPRSSLKASELRNYFLRPKSWFRCFLYIYLVIRVVRGYSLPSLY